jgi:hypothetical protein
MDLVVVVFAFNRPLHLKKTLEALAHNIGSQEINLIIYCDAARNPEEQVSVDSTRKIASNLSEFKEVKAILRETNYGLSRSIITGVSDQLREHDSIIILEDDMVTSPHFIQYMKSALDFYKHDERVISIHGYTYPVKGELPETFFLRGADCWGWATWRRGWKLFNPDGQYLLKELRNRKLLSKFDLGGAFKYSQMLEDQIQGKIDSWAIRWHASAFLENRLTLYPGVSLVHNIGNDNTGTHCKVTDRYNAPVSSKPIQISNISIEASKLALNEFQEYFYQFHSPKKRLFKKAWKMLSFPCFPYR